MRIRVYSMTGYGKVHKETGSFIISVEIKTLNNRFVHIHLSLPQQLKARELDIRKKLEQQLLRGKIECSIAMEDLSGHISSHINQAAAASYYHELKKLEASLGIQFNENEILAALLRFPEVITPLEVEIDEAQWSTLEAAIDEAIQQVMASRLNEGSRLIQDISQRVQTISRLTGEVEKQAPKRVSRIREKILESLKTLDDAIEFDRNRFEQEMIYYLEKLDITEEIERIRSHCQYFDNILQDNRPDKGKPLGFVAQELGREINTIGAKADDALIQQYVVQMKDELEKIKEQLNNIL